MTTSKALFVTSAVIAVLCVPIGYEIRSRNASPSARSQEPERSVEAAQPASDLNPTFENSGLFAEWRELHQRLGTNAEAMPVLHKAIADLKDPLRRQAFHTALIAEWAQVDPAGGFNFFLAKGRNGDQRRQFFNEWLALDPKAAVDALLANQGPGWDAMARESLLEIARRAPAQLPKVVCRLPQTESYWDNSVRDAFALLAETGLDSARKAAEQVTGPNRTQALAGIAQTWAKGDLNASIAWAKALPEGYDRSEIIRVGLLGKAAVDPIAALDLVNIVPPGGREAYFATTTGARVLAEAGKSDFDGTVNWLVNHPGRLDRNDLLGLAQCVTDRLNIDPAGFLTAQASSGSLSALMPAISSALPNRASGQRAAIWEWIKAQPEDETMRALKSEVLHSAGYQDPPLALQFVADLPATEEGDAQLRQTAQALFNGGSLLDRFDKLYREGPERLRQPLVQAAFDALHNGTLGDPAIWIARLTLLPETSRAQGTESLARAWAERAPEEAVAWLGSVPSGSAHDRALMAIASTWANTDPHGAADWIASLAPGAERDAGATALVKQIAEQFPREAWDWALSIQNEQERKQALSHSLRTMAAKDLNIAQQWIQAAPFTPEMKAGLESELARLNQTSGNRK